MNPALLNGAILKGSKYDLSVELTTACTFVFIMGFMTKSV